MKFLPITVMICLSASLLVALIFLPVLGSTLMRKNTSAQALEAGNTVNRFSAYYLALLRHLLAHPGKTLLLPFSQWWAPTPLTTPGAGVEFFPEVEPESAQILVHARGISLSMKRRHSQGSRTGGIRSTGGPIDLRSLGQSGPLRAAPDVIGTYCFNLRIGISEGPYTKFWLICPRKPLISTASSWNSAKKKRTLRW